MANPEFPIPGNTRALLPCILAVVLLPLRALAAPADNCQMQISQPVIDYGLITRAQLLERQLSPTTFALGKQTMTLSATCRQPTLMTVYFRGISRGADDYSFSNSGSFTLNLSLARVDGKRVRLGNVHITGQQPERMGESVPLTPGIGIVPVVDERPVKGTSFSVQVEIDTHIFGDASRINDKTVWRSSGSFELVEN